MEDKTLTPPAPLFPQGDFLRGVRGEKTDRGSVTTTPSPEKGRFGEGLRFLPYNKNLTALARENRKNPTPAGSLIWQKVLRGQQLGCYKFLRQKPIGPYIVDFYCSELNLVIEIDGDSHAEQLAYDIRRTAFFNSLGLQVRRYANRDILNNLPGVYDDPTSHIENQTP